MNTEQLINSLKTKDLSAFSQLYDLYSSSLFTVLHQMLPSGNDAEEALELTFVDAWKLVDTYDSKQRSVFVWLLGIAKKRAASKYNTTNNLIIPSGEKSGRNFIPYPGN